MQSVHVSVLSQVIVLHLKNFRFVLAGTAEFYSDLAVFYLSLVLVELIDHAIAIGLVDCL